MTERKAETPFYFVGCFELREMVGKTAWDLEQLLNSIEEVPPDSIYFHTHSFLLRHEKMVTAFASDFAEWAAISLRDRVVAERLSLIDPSEFTELESLRTALASAIDEHLKTLWNVPRISQGGPFRFMRSHIIEVNLEREAHTLREFRDHLSTIEHSSLFFHICDAKIRQGRQSGDFVAWIDSPYGLALPELAKQVEAIQPTGLTLEEIRRRILTILDLWLGKKRLDRRVSTSPSPPL